MRPGCAARTGQGRLLALAGAGAVAVLASGCTADVGTRLEPEAATATVTVTVEGAGSALDPGTPASEQLAGALASLTGRAPSITRNGDTLRATAAVETSQVFARSDLTGVSGMRHDTDAGTTTVTLVPATALADALRTGAATQPYPDAAAAAAAAVTTVTTTVRVGPGADPHLDGPGTVGTSPDGTTATVVRSIDDETATLTVARRTSTGGAWMLAGAAIVLAGAALGWRRARRPA